MKIQAINPKHQRALEELYQAERLHVSQMDRLAAALDELDPDRHQRTWNLLNDAESAFHEALVLRFIKRPGLPQCELDAFAKAYEAHHGHDPDLFTAGSWERTAHAIHPQQLQEFIQEPAFPSTRQELNRAELLLIRRAKAALREGEA